MPAALSTPEPMLTPSSSKKTRPVGVTDEDEVTVAVNTTVSPKREGSGLLSMVVEDWAFVTVWTRTPDVLPLKLELPAYSAVMLCIPTLSGSASEDVLKVAVPPLTVAVPSVVPSSLNVTVPPLGVAVLGDTAATLAVKTMF